MSHILRLLLFAALVLTGFGGAAPAQAQQWAVQAEPVVLDPGPPVVPEGWQVVSGPFIEVHGPADALPVMIELARHGSASIPTLAEVMGVAIGSTVHVIVAPTQRDFVALQPGAIPEWADGTAYPDRGWIFLRRPGLRGLTARPLTTVLDHELVHVLLGRAFAPTVPPRWLTEGLAQVLSGEHDPENTARLARGMLGGGLLTLEELSHGFPAEAGEAELAYAQSADFVTWMQVEYGEQAIQTLIAEMAVGSDIRKAIRAATGMFLEDVDARWRATLRNGSAPLWLSALGSDEVFWGVAAALSVIGLVLARRRITSRMALMARRERLRDAWLSSLWQRDGPAG